MSNSWGSYPKVYGLGHAAIKDLLEDPVEITEKIDGSQFSMGIFGGELKVRSKGREFEPGTQDKMFNEAVEVAEKLKPYLKEGWTYRGEYLRKPKHNALSYDRTPKNNIILFDINTGKEEYLNHDKIVDEGNKLGLEVVPLLYKGKVDNVETLKKLLEKESCLGGQKIEGFVIKNYSRFGTDGKVKMGKYVSEAFKEVHKQDWKNSNPGGKDIIGQLAEKYTTKARWNKAIQHLRERGELTDSPKDIGPLMKEVQQDLKEECEEEIKEQLFKWAWSKIGRSVTRGLPEYYKELLVENQFEKNEVIHD